MWIKILQYSNHQTSNIQIWFIWTKYLRSPNERKSQHEVFVPLWASNIVWASYSEWFHSVDAVVRSWSIDASIYVWEEGLCCFGMPWRLISNEHFCPGNNVILVISTGRQTTCIAENPAIHFFLHGCRYFPGKGGWHSHFYCHLHDWLKGCAVHPSCNPPLSRCMTEDFSSTVQSFETHAMHSLPFKPYTHCQMRCHMN